jgi:endoglucanase
MMYSGMKIEIRLWLVCSLLLLWLTSCTPDPNVLQVSETNYTIAEVGDTVALTITTDAAQWKIDNSDTTWLHLSNVSSSASNDMVTIMVNTRTVSSRTAILTIRAGTAQPVTVTITQKASQYLYTLTTDTTAFLLKRNGVGARLYLTTDAPEWNIKTNDNWLVLSKNTGSTGTDSITISALANESGKERSSDLVLSAPYTPSVTINITQLASDYLFELSASDTVINLKRNGSGTNLQISSSAPEWKLVSSANWLTLSKTSGTGKNENVSVSASVNATGLQRTATLTLSANEAPTVVITVIQSGELYPSYNTSPISADASGMASTAMQIASKMYAGWNLGNSLEVPGSETAWGNPKTTQRFIDSIAAAGFNAIRLPCAWNSYIENTTTCKLKDSWLARVKEVVDYCYKNNMYVILNIHWDGGWLENNCTTAKQVENNAKQKAIWEQIATYFRNYDEHLLFAGTNEPNVANATEMTVLLSYLQTFIDAVRSTGGRNAYRVLVFQGPSTDIDKTNSLMKKYPDDKVKDRLMVEVHYYTPWNFCGLEADADWGKMFYYWGKDYHSSTDLTRNATWGEESTVLSNFGLMKTKFVNKGIPVIMGEYGVMRRSNLTGDALTKHLASRAYFYQYVTLQAKNYGIIPFCWDNGALGAGGCGIFNRTTGSASDKQVLNAVMSGAANGKYPY